ncbi:MAG: deaminase domain-containing protein [Flavobacterium sp.]|nr:deaminase domain-containing protein [Flavobacterium sp.]
MKHFFVYRWVLLVTVFSCLSLHLLAQFEEGKKTLNTLQPALVFPNLVNGATGTNTYTSMGEVSKKLKNIILFRIQENTGIYFASSFSATVTLKVDKWLLASNATNSPDASSTETLVVNYDKTLGAKYNVRAYLVLPIAYEQVKITVMSTPVISGAIGWNPLNVLELDNQMDVTRYYNLSQNTAIATATLNALPTAYPDALDVSWLWANNLVHNNMSQLEWAWVETEALDFYKQNGVLNTDALFKSNSTRVDLDDNVLHYKIPLLYDGNGQLYYRVRAGLRKNDGSVITGVWSAVGNYAFSGHEPSLNWQSSTSFAEGGKFKSVIQYFDGSLRNRQTVTKDNETGNTIVGETIYDLQGRPNVQILPTPTIDNTIRFFDDFNRFAGQTSKTDDPARFFDLTPAAIKYQSAPKLDTAYGNGRYYSGNNNFLNEAKSKFIPNAQGYAYTETRFMDDATQRVSSQSGVGINHIIGSGKETQYFYGKPSQQELDALFGTEVGDASHYSKNMVQDANGQLSVSYVDMHGRTIATALAGDAPKNLTSIINTADYANVNPNATLTDQLISPATNLIVGNTIQSVSNLLVAAPTNYNFVYQLNPAILSQVSCSNQQICFDCKYDLEISIRQEGTDVPPTIKRYNNLQIVPANQVCGTSMGFIGDTITVPTTQIVINKSLSVGSWVVRKTLTINDSIFKLRRDSALVAFLCKSKSSIYDSVYNALYTTSGCGVPSNSTAPCDSCNAKLGNFSTYRDKYLKAIGQEGSSIYDNKIHKQYTQDSLICVGTCGVSDNLNTLTVYRKRMLHDMIPFTGQYALNPISNATTAPPTSTFLATSTEAKYNIFTANANGSQPYTHPKTETGIPTTYNTIDNLPDVSLKYDANGNSSILNNLSPNNFTKLFQQSWSNGLLYYHPEFKKLQYAEAHLSNVYAWMDKMQGITSYTQANTLGYFVPLITDPYFSIAGTSADRTIMQQSIEHYVPSSFYTPTDATTPSIWQLANGAVYCATVTDLTQKRNCILSTAKASLDSRITSADDKDRVWLQFSSAYATYRNQMLLDYLNSQAGANQTDIDNLALEHKVIVFASTQNLANYSGGGAFWSAALSGDTAAGRAAGNAYLNGNNLNLDYCEAQRPYWKSKLLLCDQLISLVNSSNSTDNNKANSIINSILDGMVQVCHNSQTSWQPYGASTVAPTYTGTPKSFEEIVNQVFAANGISTGSSSHYYCNPYSIDAPKPFGKNPTMVENVSNTVDTCNCKQFAALMAEASGLGFKANSYNSMNQFLLANYQDTLTPALFTVLSNCASNYKTGSVGSGSGKYTTFSSSSPTDGGYNFNPLVLPIPQVIPPFLNCGYQKPCLSCATLASLTTEFITIYPAYTGVPFTDVAIDDDLINRNGLWARFLNYRTGFSAGVKDYITAFNNCGGNTYTIGNGNDCGTNTAVDVLFVNNGRLAPFTTKYTARQTVIIQNSFESTTGDEFTVSIDNTLGTCTNNTGIAGTIINTNGRTTGTAICFFKKPLNNISNWYVKDTTPCSDVQTQAQFIAQLLYTKMQDSLIANFDSLYMAKCLSAQSVETFTATYGPKEYHYTLYYYDQAGNLVKTLPPAAVQPNYNSNYLSNVASSRNMGIAYPNSANNEAMATNYRYNSLNQVVAQKTPDAGATHMWYDRLGRLVLSQNAKQAQVHNYSYTMYDVLGRISQVGQVEGATEMASFGFRDANNQTYYIAPPMDENGNPTADLRDIICRNDDLWNQWINAPSANPKKQITLTVYDIPYTSIAVNAPGSLYQQNLRNRVSYSMVFNAATQMQTHVDGTIIGGTSATYYTYDIHGNVDTLVQDYNTGMGTISGNRFKKMVYSYDLISGKVNYVAYQPNAADAFYHRYGYDAENKLTKVETSKDAVYWETDATYDYYRHGPLAKTITGELQVQSVTNAYTIQGWIKGFVPGNDANQLIARQAFNYGLGYFTGDYTPIGNVANPFASIALTTSGAGVSLYNGNIAAMLIDVPKLGTAMLHTYNYDQLNRIKAVNNYNNYNATTNAWTATLANNETVSFDPNGNIKTATLNGAATSLPYENFAYTYDAVKQNRLLNITNTIGSTVTTSNYEYDAIGNMTKDELEGNLNMQWSVYGKLLHAEKANGTQINYTYDASNKCISKTIIPPSGGGGASSTFYVRDASGNIMVTYQKDAAINSGKLSTTAYQLYGSSNMGAWKKLVDVESSYTIPAYYTFTRGEHEYYFSNHLGNNLLVLSDKKLQISTNTTTIDHYEADVLNATDYSAYGENLIGREFNGSSITYGFNGKINNPETGYQDYGFRDYSARRRGFTRVDPLTSSYPWYTPYQFSGNSPIANIDLDGLEPAPATTGKTEGQTATTKDVIWYGDQTGVVTKFKHWVYHTGSKEYNTKAGWYSLEEYIQVTRPIAADLAGYLGIFSNAAGGNWSDDEKKYVAESKLGRFLSKVGDSNETAKALSATTRASAHSRNFYVSGFTEPSGFNVEDIIGIGLLLKQGLKYSATYIAKNIASGRIDFIRKALNVGVKKNIGILSGVIEGEAYYTVAVSGEALREGSVGVPILRRFTTSVVKYDRLLDSEVKLLEDFAAKFHNTPNVKGNLALTSELPFCNSCSNVITQFQKMFPNVKIHPMSGVK